VLSAAVDTGKGAVAIVAPGISITDLVSDGNKEVASRPTSDAKTGESANDGIKSLSNILNNEEMEEEQSNDTESQVSMCENDGSSQGSVFNAS